MVKYVKVNELKDFIYIEAECYCWNCEYFVAPYGCCGIFGFVTPFQWCKDWSKANEKDIEENKDKIDECCKEDKIKRINKCKGRMRAYKREIDSDFRQILAILDKEEEEEDEKRIET